MAADLQQKKIFVALSGGVDSAVTAAILKDAGHDVTGVFMKNWSGTDLGIQADCPWEKDQKDAEAVCAALDIPFRSFNFEKEYRQKVMDYFFTEFRAGRTPNPDVMCNKEIKFGIFLEKSLAMGADLIATGHYAQVRFNQELNEYELLKGIDPNKDQSYFLCELNQEQLSKTLFPVGGMLKPEVRKLAAKYKLPVAVKKDSQGICFVGEINVAQFLRVNIPVHQGDIVDVDSDKVLGRHDGIEFYTIGQREGLNLGGAQEPYFVSGKDKEHNIVYVAMGKNNPKLFRYEVAFSGLHWLNKPGKFAPGNNVEIKLEAAIRYRQQPESGMIYINENRFVFNKPQRAIAPGQLLASYQGQILRGCAVIE